MVCVPVPVARGHGAVISPDYCDAQAWRSVNDELTLPVSIGVADWGYSPAMDRALRHALINAGEVPEQCAWFRWSKAQALGSNSSVVEEVGAKTLEVLTLRPSNHRSEQLLRRDSIDLGDHVAVSVTADRVSIWADQSVRVLGRLLATYRRGTMRATCHFHQERIEVIIEDDVNGSMSMVCLSKRDDECALTAQAIEKMSFDPTHVSS